MLCRFKGADGLYNEGTALKYLRQVFTKNNNHYKFAVYDDKPSPKSFWMGYAIDKQKTGRNYRPFSDFWIENFLDSETDITDAQGTTQFAKIIKAALQQTTDLTEKEQMISAVVNIKSHPGRQISLRSFSDQYLSPKNQQKFQNLTTHDTFYNSVFGIDNEVLQEEVGSIVLQLQGGVTAFVPSSDYKKYVTEEYQVDGQRRVTITGTLQDKDMKLRKNSRAEPKTQRKK